jgi:hypothetical protein
MADVPDYSWLSHPVRPEAMCITVATGLFVEEALLAFGADPAAQPAPLTELVDGEDPSAAVVSLGTVVAIEDNGWQGSRREVDPAIASAVCWASAREPARSR